MNVTVPANRPTPPPLSVAVFSEIIQPINVAAPEVEIRTPPPSTEAPLMMCSPSKTTVPLVMEMTD
eukprot:5355977-Prymnesium_polylepis.1